MNKFVLIPIISLIFILVDIYAFQGVKWVFHNFSAGIQKTVFYLYWGITIITLLGFWTYHFGSPDALGKHGTTFILLLIFTNYISKTFVLVFVIIDDLQRAIRWVINWFSDSWFPSKNVEENTSNVISRSEFLAKAGIITAAVPIVAIGWGIVSGAHDYRVRRHTIKLPNLPSSLDGLKIGQISDIHSGSFWNKTAVKGGVDLLMEEKPDIVFFTGDLVNNQANEMSEYMSTFGKIKAEYGVYSIFGNHDYGDYMRWPSAQAKVQNLKDIVDIHAQLGWDLLRNENRILNINGAKLAILGVENWSAKARFPKYGKMAEAYSGVHDSDVKLLLSHDPSHWMEEILPHYPEIDVTFSGHTHGMQFGVEIKEFKWSPVQYIYKEWAGLYTAGNQHLYVNRGFGYLGYPGRIGIPPELTIIELKKA